MRAAPLGRAGHSQAGAPAVSPLPSASAPSCKGLGCVCFLTSGHTPTTLVCNSAPCPVLGYPRPPPDPRGLATSLPGTNVRGGSGLRAGDLGGWGAGRWGG